MDNDFDDRMDVAEGSNTAGFNEDGENEPSIRRGKEKSAGIIDIPWVTKYRPKVLSQIVGNREVVERLKDFACTGTMPHLLLSGPPGIGKTTCILCLAYELLGDHLNSAVLELNASNERGIDVVRGKIKAFAQRKVTLPEGMHKIIILDEADSMTESAQQALRRTMEIYAKSTRFALACNTSEKIIEPIQSRCAIIRFGRLPDEFIIQRMKEIAVLENARFTEAGLKAIAFVSQGDLRQALNNLQSTVSGFGIANEENVFKVCDEPQPVMIKEIINLCIISDYDKALDVLEYMWNKGYTAQDLITTFLRILKVFDFSSSHCNKIQAEKMRVEMIRAACLTNVEISKLGIGSWLQIAALIALFCEAAKNKDKSD